MKYFFNAFIIIELIFLFLQSLLFDIQIVVANDLKPFVCTLLQILIVCVSKNTQPWGVGKGLALLHLLRLEASLSTRNIIILILKQLQKTKIKNDCKREFILEIMSKCERRKRNIGCNIIGLLMWCFRSSIGKKSQKTIQELKIKLS